MNGHPRARIQPTTVVVLLGLLPVDTDALLPALPNRPREAGASVDAVQQMLTVLNIGFGLSHLLSGPAARFGRHPGLLWGMSPYTLVSMVGALAHHRHPHLLACAAARSDGGCGGVRPLHRARSVGLYAPYLAAHVLARDQRTGLASDRRPFAPVHGWATPSTARCC